jgi:Flp pilus assembly protein TadD
VHYLRLFFLPVGLTADTDLKLIADWWDTRVVAGAVLVALLALAIWRCAGHRTRWPIAFGLAWFALGLAPTSSVLPLAEPVNEHRIFLPYVGLTLAVVWAARLWLGKRLARWTAGPGPRWAAPAAVCGLILAGHAAGAHARNATWRTSESLWADVTTKSPLNGRAWMNYGLALMRRGEYPGAKAAFERAQPLTPSYSFLEVNIGILNGAMGDQQAAEAHFRRALELEADQPGSHYFYARWLVQRGRSPEAIPHLQEVVRLSPADEPARRLLLDLSSARGELDATSRQARDYLAIFPDDRRAQAYLAGRTPVAAPPATLESYLARGLALGKQEDFVESALAYREALRLGPGSSDVLNNLGWTLGKLGFFPEALPYLEAAAKLRPEAELFRNNLKWVQGQLR